MININCLNIILYILEILFLYYLMLGYESNKSSVIKFSCYCYILVLNILLQFISRNSLIKTCIMFFTVFITLCILYKINVFSILWLTILFYLIIYISESISVCIVMLCNSCFRFIFLLNDNDMRIQSLILSKTLTVILLVIIKHKGTIIGQYKISLKEKILIFTPLVIDTILIILLFMKLNDIHNQNDVNMLIFLMIISLAMLIKMGISLIFSEMFLSDKIKYLNNEKYMTKLNYQSQYYEQKKNTENDIRKIYHNLKNYSIYINQLTKDKNIEIDSQYLKELFIPLQEYSSYYNTSNKLLDVILYEKQKVAQEKNIDFICLVNFTDGDFISPLDLCVIFGNAIDNAIEACSVSEADNKEKYIEIKSKTIHSLLIIKISNSIFKKVKVINGIEIETSKENKKFHGLGLASMRQSLKKYKGEMTIEATETEFTINISINILNHFN